MWGVALSFIVCRKSNETRLKPVLLMSPLITILSYKISGLNLLIFDEDKMVAVHDYERTFPSVLDVYKFWWFGPTFFTSGWFCKKLPKIKSQRKTNTNLAQSKKSIQFRRFLKCFGDFVKNSQNKSQRKKNLYFGCKFSVLDLFKLCWFWQNSPKKSPIKNLGLFSFSFESFISTINPTRLQ